MTKLILSRNSLDNFRLHVLLIKLLSPVKHQGFFSCSLVKFYLRVNSKGQLVSPYRRDFRVDVGILSRISHVNAELARYSYIILLIRIIQLLKVMIVPISSKYESQVCSNNRYLINLALATVIVKVLVFAMPITFINSAIYIQHSKLFIKKIKAWIVK